MRVFTLALFVSPMSVFRTSGHISRCQCGFQCCRTCGLQVLAQSNVTMVLHCTQPVQFLTMGFLLLPTLGVNLFGSKKLRVICSVKPRYFRPWQLKLTPRRLASAVAAVLWLRRHWAPRTFVSRSCEEPRPHQRVGRHTASGSSAGRLGTDFLARCVRCVARCSAATISPSIASKLGAHSCRGVARFCTARGAD